MKVKLLSETAIAPSRGSDWAAGHDLHASEDAFVRNGKSTVVKTDVAIQIPEGFVALVKPRSGMAFKEGVDTMAGVTDSDYRGEVKVLLTCHGACDAIEIEKGDRIAELLIIPCLQSKVEVVDEMPGTERGEDGFGSTGK